MKSFLMSFLVMAMLSPFSVQSQTEVQAAENQAVTPDVEVYYFHFSRRCNTCVSVEENTKLSLEKLYPEQVKSGSYIFQAVNLDEKESEELAKRLGISAQALLVVHGDKKTDITGEGFMYFNNDEKLQSVIKKTIEELLKS
jgi:hypothetical protein